MMLMLTVNDLKQYFYCRRVVFFNYVMPVDRKITYKMEHGKLMEEEIQKLENRRKLKKYNLDKGERIFHLWLSSEKIGITGRLDMLVISPEGYFPVDFKYTTGWPHKNHHYQLGGYAFLVEEKYGVKVNSGFIYLIPHKNVVIIDLNGSIKNDILRILDEMRAMIIKEQMPEATKFRNKCQDCEFRNYCGDVF
jgi:CRISPR-associated exonuclease Cas4